jgi:hypothetical protein
MTRRVQASRHPLIGVIAALAGACILAIAAPAAAVPAIGCGNIEVHHKRYAVRGHVLRCSLARRWSAAFLANGAVPAGYDCQRYSRKTTRVTFLCFDPSTSTRNDGPRSFNATT